MINSLSKINLLFFLVTVIIVIEALNVILIQHLPYWLIVLPKVLLAVLIYTKFTLLNIKRIHYYCLFFLIFFLFSFAMNKLTSIYYLYLISPFFLPYCYPRFTEYFNSNKTFIFIYALIILSLLLNSLGISYNNFQYSNFLYDITFTKKYSFVIDYSVRHTGFFKSHFTCSLYIAIVSLVLIINSKKNYLKNLIFLLSTLAIFMTKVKSVGIAFIIIFFLCRLKNLKLNRYIIFTLLLFKFILLVLVFKYVDFVNYIMIESGSFFESFLIRLNSTWLLLPETFSFLGNGFGSVGVASLIINNNKIFVDSFFIHLLLTFGLFGLIIIFYFYRNIVKFKHNDSKNLIIYYSSFLLFICGITIDLMDYFVAIIFLGCLFFQKKINNKSYV